MNIEKFNTITEVKSRLYEELISSKKVNYGHWNFTVAPFIRKDIPVHGQPVEETMEQFRVYLDKNLPESILYNVEKIKTV